MNVVVSYPLNLYRNLNVVVSYPVTIDGIKEIVIAYNATVCFSQIIPFAGQTLVLRKKQTSI